MLTKNDDGKRVRGVYQPVASDGTIQSTLFGGFEALTATAWPFIDRDENGCPTIRIKRFKVLHLVREHLTFDWDAEQLHRQHPHLSLSEIHSALGYYYDHREDCDRLLEQEEQRLEELKQKLVNPNLQERLKLARESA